MSRRCCRRRRRRWSGPRALPSCSRSVIRSASAWQGCSSSVSALTTRKTGSRRSELFDDLLRERADHDGVHPALEIARDVGDRFAFAQRHFGRDEHRRAAELTNRDLEGDPGPERRLVEEQRDVPAGQDACRGAFGPCRAAFMSAARFRHRSISSGDASSSDTNDRTCAGRIDARTTRGAFTGRMRAGTRAALGRLMSGTPR